MSGFDAILAQWEADRAERSVRERAERQRATVYDSFICLTLVVLAVCALWGTCRMDYHANRYHELLRDRDPAVALPTEVPAYRVTLPR